MQKPTFKHVKEAIQAARADKLSATYVKPDNVFIVTAFGTGKFPRDEYETAKRELNEGK